MVAQINRLKEHHFFFIVVFFALGVYLRTMPSGLTFAHFGVDGGDLIAASVHWGIPHPPGYPLYVVLGNLISGLPIGSVAYRFNLLSAIPMALSAGVVTLICHSKMPNDAKPISVAMGLSYAFASLIWQQAIITEVYGLLMLFLSLTLYAVALKKGGFWVGLGWGLSLVSHLTAVFLLPLLIYHLWQTQKGVQKWQPFLFGLAVGLLPFLWLPLFALTPSPIMWGNPLTVHGYFSLVSAEIYHTLPFGLPLNQLQDRLWEWLPIWANQLTLAGLPLLLFSFWLAKSENQLKEKFIWLLSLVLFFSYALFYNSGDAIVFSLPAILIALILMRNGFIFFKNYTFLLPLTLILLNFTSVNIYQDRFVHQQLDTLLEKVPQNALLETSGEAILFPLWYAKFVEHRREDILLVDNQLFTYAWYRDTLSVQDESLTLLGEAFSQFRMQQSEKRPYCNIVSHSETETTVQVNCQPPAHDE